MSGDGAKRGRFLGVPYDFSRPTWGRLKREVWDPSDQRILKPKGVFGAGGALNFHRVVRRLRLTR